MKKSCIIPVAVLLLSVACTRQSGTQITKGVNLPVPVFRVDPFWPKPLPDNWLIGQVSGIATDSEDHIWIVQRPGSLVENETNTLPAGVYPYLPAPPVMEFDTDGNLLWSWGGPGEGYLWAQAEHGIFIDHENNIWINGGGSGNHQVLKFTREGKFLLAIGKPGETGGNNDTIRLGFPTGFYVDPAENEVFISDGYVNNRVVVFNSGTGKYKRHWGAYGKKPEDNYNPENPGLDHFRTPHDIRISVDGLVYLADRVNNRIQVFRKDGSFVSEVFVAKETAGLGSAWAVNFSHDPRQRFIYVADGTNQNVWILERENLKEAGHIGRMGRNAGQFIWLHSVAVDSKGNVYTGEVFTGKRVQKFIYQ